MEQAQMRNTKELDSIAILWNKTKDIRYKELWYQKVKEWHGKNINNINTSVRWNVNTRKIQFNKRDVSA